MDNSNPDLPSSPPTDNFTSKAKISVKTKVPTSYNSSKDPVVQVVGDGLDAGESSTDRRPQSGQLGYRVCEFCGKKFSSGKAWGGHKRHHLKIMRNSKKIEEGSSSSIKKIKTMMNKQHHHQQQQQYRRCAFIKAGDVTTSGGKPTCCLCGKSFASINSLFGHMRFHPDRDCMGIQPLDEKEPIVDLLSSLPSGWPKRDKRGRISLTDWVPQAAYSLWALSQDAGNVKNTIGSAIKISRKSIDEEEHDQTDEMGIKKKKKKKKKKLNNTSKLKDTEIQTESYGFRCGNCDRSFLSFQALGGHRSSCPLKDKRSKEIAEIDYEYDDDDAEEIRASEPDESEENGEQDHPVVVSMEPSFHCDVCDKIFPTGQALGGHKRCHRKAPAKPLSNEVVSGGETSNVASNTASSGEAVSQLAEAIQASHGMLGIDLNKPYVIQDDEDEG